MTGILLPKTDMKKTDNTGNSITSIPRGMESLSSPIGVIEANKTLINSSLIIKQQYK